MQHQRIAHFSTETALRPRKGFVTAALQSTTCKTSILQPVGTQGRLIDAAVIAARRGTPINRLLTVRTMALENTDVKSRFGRTTLAEDVQAYLELLRKWLVAHGVRCVFIWAREWGHTHGEHLHIGFHLVNDLDTAFAEQCARWFGEQAKVKSPTKAIVAESVLGVWQVKHCLRGGTTGPQIAAYIGKDEPEFMLTAWGKKRPNREKRNCWHTETEGLIIGLPRHIYRHGTSRNISPTSPTGKAILALATDEERLIGILMRLPF